MSPPGGQHGGDHHHDGEDLGDVWDALLEIFHTAAGERGYFQATPKKGRGLGKKTLALRQSILEAFDETSKPVTVRQMFYLLSVRGAVEKTEAGYGKAQRQLLAMRREGWIPYAWIADNTRWMRKPTTYGGLSDFFERSARFYRQDLWIKSDDYVEIWCEKDALAGVLMAVTEEFDVPLMVARGYSSESFAYDAAMNVRDMEKDGYVYYFGDFDPSGWQMAENLEEKLLDFGADICFTRVSVNPDQIRDWDLQARPSKRSDTRIKRFEELFGRDAESVELDAVHPDKLRQMVRDCIENHIDRDELEALRREEEAGREALEKMAESYRGGGG